MDFSFFTVDNKSGYKTQEKWFSKNYFIEYEKILNYSNKLNIEMNFKEKIWFYYNNLIERPKCITCGGEIKFRNRFDKPYGEFCSLSCINLNKEEMIKRQKVTFQKKYNINFYPQHKDFLSKQRKTKLERYNDENYNNSRKMINTKLKIYGSENYCNHNKYVETCKEKYGVENFSKTKEFKNIMDERFQKLYLNVNIIKILKNKIEIKCDICNKISEIEKHLLYGRIKHDQIICPLCNPIGQSQKSGYEIKISEFLDELFIKHISSDRKTLTKQELDIIVPEFNLAIEFDGVYWHNELFLPFDYHLKKTIECQEKNIELIHIFEDEWVNKKEIVQSIIKNRLQKTDNTLFARKCRIKEIDPKICKIFLDENHIQGNVNSKIKIGLYHDDELVSVMSFSKGRILMSGKANEWELTRFCNKINTNVVGAAGKLFNYFVKNYYPTKIVSYSDIRLFNGNMYKNLGFEKISQSKPNYWYVINGIRYHRFNFRKSILIKEGFDVNKTEKEIMFDRKIYRIYDCGHIRWEYNVLK
jgi:hypothetical protein